MEISTSYYAILDVAPESSPEAIKIAFRTAAKLHHPDQFGSYIQKVRATTRMQEINAAYSVLRDPQMRTAYDSRRFGRETAEVDPASAQHAHEATPYPPQQPSNQGPVFRDTGDQRRSIDPIHVVAIVIWLAASGVYGYSMWDSAAPSTWTAMMEVAIISLLVSPLLLLFFGSMLLIPAVTVGIAFSKAFHNRRPSKASSRWIVARDLFLRFVALGGLVTVAWYLGFTPGLVTMAVLIVGAGLLGEIVAMVVFLSRSSVQRTTETLLGVEIEPMPRPENGV